LPRPKRLLQRRPWLGNVPYGRGLLHTGLAPTFGWLTTVGTVLASLACLIHAGFGQRDTVSRAQLPFNKDRLPTRAGW
jgi:hypothetical protein